MEDLKSLERFLRTEEEKSHRSQLGTVCQCCRNSIASINRAGCSGFIHTESPSDISETGICRVSSLFLEALANNIPSLGIIISIRVDVEKYVNVLLYIIVE